MAGPQKQHKERAPRAPRYDRKGAPNKVLDQHFDSISAFGEHVAALEKASVLGARPTYASQRTPEQRWDYNTTLAEAIEITQNGGSWLEGAEQLAAIDINHDNVSDYAIKPYYDLSPVGGCVDVVEYLSGNPECMLGITDETPTAPIIKISFIAVACHNISADQLFNYGRAMLAFIDSLETQGYSVELVGVLSFIHRSKAGIESGYNAHITVKQAGDDWSAAAIAYSMAHPAFSRRVGFRACEAVDESATARHNGYGRGRIKSDADIHFPYIDTPRQLNTPEKALNYVIQTAQQQKAGLFE